MGWTVRASVSNYVFNHIGMFAIAGELTALSLFMGGVPQRFPTLRFAFQEGGVAWAAALYANLVGHWEKRNRDAVEHYNPAHLDRAQVESLFEQYGSTRYRERLDQLDAGLRMLSLPDEDPTTLDEFARSGITDADEIRDVFTSSYHFGCEADDPMTAWAFDRHGNHRLRPIFSSDVGHFDVVDMTEVLEEAYELVEHDMITPDNLREFVFENPVRLHTALNPDFFKGTVVEGAVAKLTAAS
jgi:hypothetical protein